MYMVYHHSVIKCTERDKIVWAESFYSPTELVTGLRLSHLSEKVMLMESIYRFS